MEEWPSQAVRHVHFYLYARCVVSILAYQNYHYVAFTDCIPSLSLPFLIRVGLIKGTVMDTVWTFFLSLSEEIVLEVLVFVELETYEYLDGSHYTHLLT